MKRTKEKTVSVKEQQRRQQLRMGNQDPAMIARRRMGQQVYWMRKKGGLSGYPHPVAEGECARKSEGANSKTAIKPTPGTNPLQKNLGRRW